MNSIKYQKSIGKAVQHFRNDFLNFQQFFSNFSPFIDFCVNYIIINFLVILAQQDFSFQGTGALIDHMHILSNS